MDFYETIRSMMESSLNASTFGEWVIVFMQMYAAPVSIMS